MGWVYGSRDDMKFDFGAVLKLEAWTVWARLDKI